MTLAENIRREGHLEGREKGLQKGIFIGQIIACQEILGFAPASKEALAGESLEELQRTLEKLKSDVSKVLRQS